MRGILYKEFLLSRTIIIVSAIYAALFGLVYSVGLGSDDESMMMGMVGCAVCFFLLSFMNEQFFRRDEKSCWLSFASSAPQSLKGQIEGKYILLLYMKVQTLFIFFVADNVAALVSGSSHVLSVALIMFCVMLIADAVEIPFMIRFGAEKGLAIKCAGIGAAAFIIGVYLLFGDISFLLKDDFIEAVIEMFSGGVALWAISLLPYAAAAAYYISYKISVRLYRKGAENYEQ